MILHQINERCVCVTCLSHSKSHIEAFSISEATHEDVIEVPVDMRVVYLLLSKDQSSLLLQRVWLSTCDSFLFSHYWGLLRPWGLLTRSSCLADWCVVLIAWWLLLFLWLILGLSRSLSVCNFVHLNRLLFLSGLLKLLSFLFGSFLIVTLLLFFKFFLTLLSISTNGLSQHVKSLDCFLASFSFSLLRFFLESLV